MRGGGERRPNEELSRTPRGAARAIVGVVTHPWKAKEHLMSAKRRERVEPGILPAPGSQT